MKNWKFILFVVGYVAVIVGAALLDYSTLSRYIVVGGAVLCTVFRFLLLPQSDNRNIRRLNTQQFFCALLMLSGAWLVWKGHSAWPLPLLICAVIDLWLSFRYGKYERQ